METNPKQNQPRNQDEIEINLVEIFYVLLHRLWAIILAGVICAAGVGIYTVEMITPMYQSTSMIYITSKSTSITSLTDLQVGTQLAPDYMVLLKSRPVLEQVIENLDLNMGYGTLNGMVSLSNPTDTRFISITVTCEDPQLAKDIADEISEVSVNKVAELMRTDDPSIIEKGQVPTSPSSPNLARNCMMGGLVGIIIVVGIILIRYMANDDIRNRDDVERYLGLTVLGLIPSEESEENEHKGKRKKKRKSKRKEAGR